MTKPLPHRPRVTTRSASATRSSREALARGPDTRISSLPLGVFRIPPCRWILSLRRHDGSREIRQVRGDLLAARERRDSLMATERYSMAWLVEAQEGPEVYRRRKTRKVEET